MRILVTGGTGFVGRHTLAALTRDQHDVTVLMRRPQALPELRRRVAELGGAAARLSALAGDLAAPDAWADVARRSDSAAVIHLGAAFAWGLERELARRTNVSGALAVAEVARDLGARLVLVSGFMLENAEHLARLGIAPEDPARTDWARVYRRAGHYEASKLEGALRVRALAAREGLDYVEVQPGTVAGHSVSGELASGQPLAGLLANLAAGRLALVPGTPRHWLPLVSVDALAALIAAAATAEAAPRSLLALDPHTPNLAGLLAGFAAVLGQRPPRRHLPLLVLAGLLRLPGLARLLQTAPESLHFIQPTRFDTGPMERFVREQGLDWPEMDAVIRRTAAYWLCMRDRAAAVAAPTVG